MQRSTFHRLAPVLGAIPMMLALASCSSPPRLPGVDESSKHPANAAMAVELQVCKSALQNTHIHADENAHAAEAEKAAIESFMRLQTTSARPDGAPEARNTVYSILFAFNSIRVSLPEADATRILDEARAAPLIVLRGRTDGAMESPGESRIARERADAVRDYLVHAGVPPTHIRATWQPVGDPAADNTSAGGRSLNRRVEIEIYRSAPHIVAPGTGSST